MQENQKIEFRKVRDFGQKFNATFEFLRQEFKPLMNALLYIAGPFIVLGGIMGAYYQKNSISLMNLSLDSEEFFADDFWISAVVMIVFSFLAYIFIFATLNEYIKIYNQKNTSVQAQEVWTSVKRNLGDYFLSAIGLSFILLGIGIVMGLIAGGIIASNILFLNILLILGIFIGTFFMMVAFYISYIAFNTEKLGLFSSLGRTISILKGNWFSTLGLFIVSWLMSSLLNIIFSLPNLILTSLSVFHAATADEGVQLSLGQEIIYGFTAFIASSGGFFISIIIMLIMIFQYYNLVEQSDATGLMGRIDAIGTGGNEDDEEHY